MLARVHHYGLRDKVNRRGTEVKYAERPLIGLHKEVEQSLERIFWDWLS